MININSVLSLEVNTATAGNNLIKNHSGAYGTWGWTVTGNGGAGTLFGDLGFIFGASTAKFTTSEYLPITATQWVGLKLFSKVYGPAGRGMTVKVYFYNASNVQVGSAVTLLSSIVPTGAGGTLAATPAQAPATTTKMKLDFECIGSSSPSVLLNKIMVTTAATSGTANQNFPVDSWVNILGKAVSITTETGNNLEGVEDQLQPGLLTAVVDDPALDPATNSALKKGRPIRLVAISGSKPVFQGTIETADSVYLGNAPAGPKTRITITAIDAMRDLFTTQMSTQLAGTFREQVALAALNARLPTYDGSAVPAQATGAVQALDQNATSADWVRRACNTWSGKVWVDQSGVIQSRLTSSLATTAAYTFSDASSDVGALYYTDIGLNYGSRAMVNQLSVTRFNVDEIEEDSKIYGPYTVNESQIANGLASAGIEITTGSPSTVAAAQLAVFANPTIFPTEISFDATDDLAKTLSVKHYDPVRVKRAALYDAVTRVLRIRHDITPDKWVTVFMVRPLETSSTVVVVSPPAGADTGPGDIDTGSGTGFPRLMARYRDTNAAALVVNTWTTFVCDKVETADGITYDAATDEYVMTRAGRYQVSGSARLDVAGASYKQLRVTVNGSQKMRNLVYAANTGHPTISGSLKLAPGDRIRFQLFSNLASTIPVSDAERDCWQSVLYVGP